ncbi:hypothetical protein PG996_012686 [Apiospora saccharicola]|uniref:Pyruvate decarboxylase n=1 Tax=Apiospora saccharicola TaxID=335842 RepID=A0ABR1U3A1_9PEZI
MASTLDIRTQNLKKPITVAEYLFNRLHQMGVRSVHGLPGDYNLVALDYLPSCNLKWVGSVNELNASYAADGYARVKGISALITTFGVGELSAINGIAGAYSEMVPVVHIVGCPNTASQKNGLMLHHTLGNGDFNVFADMSALVSCAVAKLNDPAEIATQIDHTLRECYMQSRPVYLMLPTDMIEAKVEGDRLTQEIDLREPENDAEKEDYVVEVMLRYIQAAKKPVVLADACSIRHRVVPELHAFIEKTGLPTFVTPMGKGAVNEELDIFGGVYVGNASHPEVQEMVESSDLVITVGGLKSDFNTAGFSYRMSQLNTIDLHSYSCGVRYSEYPGVKMRGVLKKLTERIDVSSLNVHKVTPSQYLKGIEPQSNGADDGVITQEWLWPRVSTFLKKHDIVVTETGTANFGIWDTKFPEGVSGLNQTLWGSIGWAVGACQGAALASKDGEMGRRTVLFEGDGSFQLTAQEVTTMIRHNLDIILFVICNDGYTIERFIHGMDAEYNDIVTWDYKGTVDVFGGANNPNVKKYVVKTKNELSTLMKEDDFNNRKGLRFVELYMPRDDAPRSLISTANAAAARNASK